LILIWILILDFKNNVNKQKQIIDIEIGKTTMQRAIQTTNNP